MSFQEEKAALLKTLQMIEKRSPGEWTITFVDDGEERLPAAGKTLEEIVADASAVDMSHIFFQHRHAQLGSNGKPRNHYMMLVWGNSPAELIADHTIGDGFDEALDAVHEQLFPEWH